MEVRKQFGIRLRQLRLGTHLTQKKLGLMVGMSPRYVSDLENGRRNPTLTCIAKLAKGLGVSLSELLDGVDSYE